MAMLFHLRTKTQSPNSAVLLKEPVFEKIYGHCVLEKTVDMLSFENIVGIFQEEAHAGKLIELDFLRVLGGLPIFSEKFRSCLADQIGDELS